MDEGQEKMFEAPRNDDSYAKHKDQWVIVEGSGDDEINGTYNDTCSLDNSSTTNGSTTSSSLDMVDDDASSCSSSDSTNDPLFELSELMAHLPIKKGLSKYYQGKSQSYTSLSRVTSIEDLAKKETPYRRRMKASKSYANGLDFHRSYSTLPKPIIAKKVSRGSMSSSLCFPGRRGSFLNTTRPPPIPLHKKF